MSRRYCTFAVSHVGAGAHVVFAAPALIHAMRRFFRESGTRMLGYGGMARAFISRIMALPVALPARTIRAAPA